MLLAIAIATVGCTGSETGTTTAAAPPTTIQPATNSAVDPPSQMNEALGGTQAVQDFVIHLDMSLQTDDGPVSFYQEVLDRAESGAGEPVDLTGGFMVVPVDSLEGFVIDSQGEPVPSISTDFALMTATTDRFEDSRARLADRLVASGGQDVADAISEVNNGETALLVELVTAHYADKRTHAGPGDRSVIDLTFVNTIAPGDNLSSSYLFGQTLPGDPQTEQGLSAQELFAYRWNEGLVAVLEDEGGVTTITDPTIEAREGSTLVTREIKAALIAAVGANILDRNLSEDAADDILATKIVTVDGRRLRQGMHEGHVVQIDIETNRLVRSFSPENFIFATALKRALRACGQLAAYLNQRNEAGGIPITELEGLGVETTETDAGTSTTTTSPEEQEPVSCGQPTPKAGGLPSPPSAGVWGDPHIRTIDGNFYDNMATGEFLVFDNGDATIQMRTEPLPGQDSVSLATAFAFRIGNHTISLHPDGNTWIDGERTQLTRGETIAVGDGDLLRWEGGWVLVWSDGTIARVYLRTAALILVVTPSDRPSEGMLGDNNGDPANDLVTRSGVQLDSDADDDFETFYSTYIDSWRISEDESLFHYEAGESTASFAVDGFPATDSAASDLLPDIRTAAEEVCTGVGVPADQFLENCVLDVGLTGDTSFAYDAFVVAASTPLPESTDDTDTDPNRASGAGDNTVTVGGLTVAFGSDPPIQDPNGVTPRWQCQVTDGSFHASGRFDETPTRAFEVTIEFLDAQTSGTGEERFTLTIKLNSVDYMWVLNWAEQFSDAVDSISLDGTTLTAAGSAFVNDELSPALTPFSALPAGTELQPFALHAICDQ